MNTFNFRVEKNSDELVIETNYQAKECIEIINNSNFNRMISTEGTEITEVTEVPNEVIEPAVENFETIVTPFYEKKAETNTEKNVVGSSKTFRKPRTNTKSTNIFPSPDLWVTACHLNEEYNKKYKLRKINFAMLMYAVGRTHSLNKDTLDLNAEIDFEIPQYLKDKHNPNLHKQPVKHTLQDGSRLHEHTCQMLIPNTFSKKELDPIKIRKDFIKEATKYKVQPCDLFNYYATEGANYLYKNNPDFFKFSESSHNTVTLTDSERKWASLAK